VVPDGQVHTAAPWLTEQVATSSQAAVAQGSVQTVPLPKVSTVLGGQVHAKPPPVLLQIAMGSQLSLPSPHSSMSVQTVPVPRYPARQVQVNDPGGLFEQLAFGSQLSVFAVHSFTSVHVTPLPV